MKSAFTLMLMAVVCAVLTTGCAPGDGPTGGGTGTPLAVATLTAPTGLNKTSSIQTFIWSAVPNATSYTLEIKQVGGSAFSPNPPVNLSGIVQNNITVGGFEANKLYEWRVRAQANGFTPSQSAYVQFGTAPVLTKPGFAAPADPVPASDG